MLDGDLVVGDDDALHHQAQDLLLDLEGRVDQLRLSRAQKPDRLRQGRPLRLDDLLPDDLLPLPELLPRLAQALAALLSSSSSTAPPGRRPGGAAPPASRAARCRSTRVQLPLGVGERRPVARLLLAQVGQEERPADSAGPDLLPDDRLDVALADAASLAAALGRLAAAPPRALVAPAGDPGVSAEAPPAGAADEQARAGGTGAASCAASARG